MSDEQPNNENATETDLAAEAEAGQVTDAAEQEAGASEADAALDEQIMAALGGDDDDEADQQRIAADLEAANEFEQGETATDGDTDQSSEAHARGLEVLMTQRQFTPEQAREMMRQQPDLVAQIGQGAIDADAAAAEAETGDDDAKPEAETEAKPETEAGETEAVEFDRDAVAAQITEALGDQFDKAESEAISGAIGKALDAILPKISAAPKVDAPDFGELIGKALGDRVAAFESKMGKYEAMASEVMARQHVPAMIEAHPEVGTEEGFRKVYDKAVALSKSAQFESVSQIMDAAAMIVFGATRTAELTKHKDKIKSARDKGTLTQGKARNTGERSMSREDLALSMALDGVSQSDIERELARRG